ncbi:MAG TPA: sensor domain-containing diguanylate cyclase [Thermodesulfovibrionales bacterium]|nr:sensor domain-containing diguanylate cyclase [Thermodesulfovibrionales bacterium]
MIIHVIEPDMLARLLHRHKRRKRGGQAVDLSVLLREVLSWANRLIPSESGSILLDDPVLKMKSKRGGRLYFTACFGRRSSSLAGTYLPDDLGIAGETYRTGRPYISRDVRKDRRFYSKIDEILEYRTRSIICSPIDVDGALVGVIELVNKKNSSQFKTEDLILLKIFAGYTGTLIKNALNANDIEEESRRDNLTRLYNARFFFGSLESAIEKALGSGGYLTLIFFDLDHFKDVNDCYGHLAGSAVLRQVADILRKIFRGTDAVMARYGGDEYVIMLPGKGLEVSIPYAESIRRGMESATFLPKGVPGDSRARNIRGVITCSIGVASLAGTPMVGANARRIAEGLIKSADKAMYEAKKAGRNAVAIAQAEGQHDYCSKPDTGP